MERKALPFLALIGLCVLLTAMVLHGMGQPWICPCGVVKLWYALPNSGETSQHLMDWYSPSHFLHGVVFWAGLSGLNRLWVWRGGRGLPWQALLLAAVVLECGWELLENSPFIVERYRQTALNLGYAGDSVLNSVSDITFMTLGFLLARRLPLWANVLLFVALEAFCAVMIRDNLTLNVIMLLYPVDAINVWQAGLSI